MSHLIRTLKNKDGMALLLVLCVFALLTAFGVSLYFAANASVAGSTDNFKDEQARLSAQSVCEIIRSELTGTAPNALRTRVNGLNVNDSMDLDAVLPDSMGSIKGSIARTSQTDLVVTVRAVCRGSICKLEMLLDRQGDGTNVSWTFSGYRPLLPAPKEEIP